MAVAARRRRRETGAPGGRSTNDQILRDILRTRLELIRTEAAVQRDHVLPHIRTMIAEIGRILRRADDGTPLGDWTRGRLERLLATAEGTLAATAEEAGRGLVRGLNDAAEEEAGKIRDILEKRVPEPVFQASFTGLDVQTTAFISSAPQEKLVGQWFQGWNKTNMDLLREDLAQTILQGEDFERAKRRVARSLGKQAAAVDAVVRTAVQTAANDAHQKTYAGMQGVMKGQMWVATLDNRTCPVCGPLDGLWWSYRKKLPGAEGLVSDRPPIPRHPRCRCLYSPVMRSAKDLGFAGALPPGERASMNGRVPDSLKWDQWQQSHKKEDRAIGWEDGAQRVIERIYREELLRSVV